MKNLKKKKNRIQRIIFTLSILLNLFLLALVAYNWHILRNKADYFSFLHSSFTYPSSHTDSIDTVCLVGNSIFANWGNYDSSPFSSGTYINRAIGGNTSSQILLRFQQDVIATNPTIVVLMTGINDIAQGDGFYNQNFTLFNIQSIADICKTNNIELVLCSVLPATHIALNRFAKIKDIQDDIESLNSEIKEVAKKNSLNYIDFHSSLKNTDGTFNEKYNTDGVHPNKLGYSIMHEILINEINRIKTTTN